jgi:hypothetical protein
MAEDLQKAGTQAIAKRESFIEEGDRSGTENINPNEMRLPRLGFAQGLSPQLIEEDSNYIPDLKIGDMFDDLTGVIYGRGPIKFVPVRRDVRYILFAADGKTLERPNVTKDDPDFEELTTWSQIGGERKPPRATKYTEFVVLLIRGDAPAYPIVLSIKDTNKFNRRAAEKLTGFIMYLQKPIYAGFYTVTSKIEKNEHGSFAVPVIKQAGLLDDPNVTDEQWEQNKLLYQFAKMTSDALRGKDIVINREEREPGDEADDFPTD